MSAEPEGEPIEIEFSTPERSERLVHDPVGDSRGCQHYFERVSPTEALCRNPQCALGLFVNPTDRIEGGKIEHVW